MHSVFISVSSWISQVAQVGVNGYPEWLDHLPPGWPGWLIALVTLGWSRFGAPAKALVDALVSHTNAMRTGMEGIAKALEHVSETQKTLAGTTASIADTQGKLADISSKISRVAEDMDDTAHRLEEILEDTSKHAKGRV